jgi:hypothetical protein
MGILDKSKNEKSISKLGHIDSKLYYIILVAIIIISFIVRLKKFTFYYTYDLQDSLGAVYNMYTYYKLIGLAILFAVSSAIYIYRNKVNHIKWKFDSISIAVILIIGSSIIATLFTPLTKEAFWGFYTRTNGLLAYISLFGLFYIVSNLKLEDRHLKILTHVVNTVSIVLITIGIFEFFGYHILQMDWYRNLYIPAELRETINVSMNAREFTYSASSILSQQNYFGAYCSIIFPFITIQAIDSKKWLDKIIFSLGSIMLFVGAYISVSIGPWITLLVTLSLVLITFKHWKSYIHLIVLLLLYSLATSVFIRYQPWAMTDTFNIIRSAIEILNLKLVFLVGAGILLFAMYYKYQKINKSKFISIIIIICILSTIIAFCFVLQYVVQSNMGMLSNRGYVWHYTYQMLKDNFMLGYGPDTFYYNFPQVNPDAIQYSQNVVFDKPHNMYMQVFVDNGLLGIVGFIVLLVATLLTLLKSTYSSKSLTSFVYSKATFFTTVAYMIQGMTNDNHMVIQPILYLLIATGIASSKKHSIT